ncbi:MAG: AsmA family protein [Pseudomonadota bacterium]|nr:AsmA family protein [Pseudomonadota bacterium]
MDTPDTPPQPDETVDTAPSVTDAPAPAAQPVRRRLPRPWRIARNVVLGILALIFLAWLVLYITKGRFLKHTFERIISGQTHRPVTVTGDFQLYFDPIKIKFYAEGMTIANPAWATRPNLFLAQKIDTRIAPLSLIFGKRHFYWLDLTQGTVDLEWNPAHTTNTWTFSAEKGGKPLEFPRIDRATVAGTTLRYLDPRMQLLADLGIDTIASTNAVIGKSVGVHGTGRIRETPFRVTAQLLSPDATANRGQNKLTLRAWAANNVIDVAGTLPTIADIENVPLRVRARGRNMAELLGIIGVVIPATRQYTLAAQLVQSGQDYRFTDMTGRFGDSDLAGRLTVTNGDRLHLDSVLATRKLDIVDAAPFIGYNPDIVAAKGAVAAAAATGAGAQRVLPDAALPVATMRAFDADLKWTIGVIRSKNVPVSNIDLTLALDHGRLALSPLTFVMARGNVASDIIFDTRQRPAADSYDIRLAPTPMGRLLAGYGVDESGTTGTVKGRIKLEGRGDTIHDSLASANGRMAFTMPQGTFWTRNVQISELDIGTFAQKMFQHKLKEPVRINCGLIAFTVRDGVAAADPILIDTTKNIMLARGGFSFKTEAIDMAVRADGKKFSFFSGQSPIAVNGHFASPGINPISPQLLGRAGAGIALGVVASPLAAVLAFVDIGDAKGASCGPVLAGATASAQRTTKGKPRDDVGHGTTAKEENGKKSSGEKAEQKKKFLGIF